MRGGAVKHEHIWGNSAQELNKVKTEPATLMTNMILAVDRMLCSNVPQ
jgi:hypothetical protein